MHGINPDLEAEYNNRALVPEHPAIFERWRRESADYRQNTSCTLDLAYGTETRHRLDLFHATSPRGTLVFIHGGYWRSLDKSDFSFVARPFIEARLSVAAINYRLCPSVPISEIVADCQQALAWIIANGGTYGLPVDRIALSGHSAGAHLVAMLYATGWAQQKINPDCIVGGMALSGVYDLEPLIHCSMNADLKLNHHTARSASPIKLAPSWDVPLHLATGSRESRAFQAQSRELAAAWPQICDSPEDVADANHFTVVDSFSQQAHPTCQRVLRLFG